MGTDAELSQSDADLFRWVSSESKNIPNDERRVSKRHNYSVTQWIPGRHTGIAASSG